MVFVVINDQGKYKYVLSDRGDEQQYKQWINTLMTLI